MNTETTPTEQPRQTWLIDGDIALRGLEASDAKWTLAWRGSPFPISAKQGEQLVEKLGSGGEATWLVATRADDNTPVAGAKLDFDTDRPSVTIDLFAAPWLVNEGQAEKAAMVRALTPWLIDERGLPAVSININGGETEPIAALEALGYRLGYRIREGRFVSGERRDWLSYELLNPRWVGILGDPGPGIAYERADAPEPRRPGMLPRDRGDLPLPPNTLLFSERLALRPFEVEEAEAVSQLRMRETEFAHDQGRWPMSPLRLANWFKEMGKEDVPGDMELAVVARADNALIGKVGLFDIDWLNLTAETASMIFDPERRSGGYGSEAKQLLLEYAFNHLGLHVLWSWVHHYNERSAAALRKQGYRDAGRAWWTDSARGEFGNGMVFDLLASEWRAARR